MPSESLEQLLARAADAYGIEPGFWDIWGNHHAASASLQQAVLSAMGIPCGSAEELEQALAERTRREWRRLAPPSVVASESQPRWLPLHVPAESLGERLAVTVRREDGSAATSETALQELPQTASLEMDGRTWLRRELRLPDDLPLGYHHISARLGPLTAETRYIVTPDRAWVHPHLGRGGRSAGLAVALYGLRSARNWGCGDFRDLLDLIDWAAAGLHVGFIGLNPLHAIHNRRPFNTSPYLPNSIFYQNFLYLDVEGLEDYARCRRARALRARPGICAEIEQLRASPLVEYERVSALKLRFLKLCFIQFLREWRAGGPRARAFEAFRAREGDLLHKFAAYCALDEYLHRLDPDCWVWPRWPLEFRDPASPAVRAFQKKHWRAVLFYQYLQWQIDLQLGRAQQRARERGLPLGLYHDLALATDGVGSDLWAHRAFFVPGCRVGSPPDDFSPAGQDWGFPPPRSEHHREDGYRFFAETIRKNCRHGGALRIDHVMRLFRLYWIPDGLDASQGLYVREQSEDYLRVLALESVRNQVVIVGEDLGTVEPAIRETLARFGIFSYRLFYFEKDQRGAFLPGDRYPKQALVSSTTHDLPTLAGFWTGADIEARRQAGAIDEAAHRSQLAARAGEKQKMLDALSSSGLLPPDRPRDAAAYPELSAELHNAIIGFLALASSQLLAVNQEDLTKETLQQNLPGTTSQYPNWGRKMRFTLEQLRSDPQTAGYTAMFRDWIVRSGRAGRRE